MANEFPLLSFVIPCLNESRTIAEVIEECHQGGQQIEGNYEVIVADNGSSDGSRDIAIAHGARVVEVLTRGYGAALSAGIDAAKGKYVLMGDADSTYEFRQAWQFLERLQQGNDLVMGNRFQGSIAPGAMPLLHRYLGNPILSMLGRMFFGIKIGDFHCGLRAFDRKALQVLNLRCSGMEFATEMIIKSSLLDLAMAEIPTNLRPNPPGRSPHLKTWRDGWRHLKFMLSFAPKYSLLSVSVLLLLLAASLVFCFILRLAPFTGANSLVFAATLSVASISILSDYLLTREMIYNSLALHKSQHSLLVDRLLGLHRGTDRLFKLAANAICVALLLFCILCIFSFRGELSRPASALTGFFACTFALSSILIYLTAAKITSYRAFHY
jgi:glycosyltransferase involved in cell wall biosynthesis